MIFLGICRLWGTRWDGNPNKPAPSCYTTAFFPSWVEAPLFRHSIKAARTQLFKWSKPMSVRMWASCQEDWHMKLIFHERTQLNIYLISCLQFNLIYKTLHNVTFSIKNKWCRPDIWRVGIYFLQAFWLSSAKHPDFQCWESQTEKYQSQLNNLSLCICGDFCLWRSVDS